MKYITVILLTLSLYGCANVAKTPPSNDAPKLCSGDTKLPANMVGKFKEISNDALLKTALGKPKEGKLCQGKTYISNTDAKTTDAKIIIHRAWNSTNPNSEMGNWWAFHAPTGKVANYRKDYEICYQWSPLDKLTQCQLKAGTHIVIGTGQSAECSQYVTHAISPKKQIYIVDAAKSVLNCKTYDNEFKWKRKH